MEKSYNYRRRKELMAKLQVPSIGETKRELGEGMAKILFDQCPDPLKGEFGLTPTLDGPGSELWVSPSDLLIPKVCLKPPLTNKYIKALTHEGILEIGEDIDRRYWMQMEEEKRKALDEQREIITKIAEMERKVAIKLARQEEREIAAENVETLMEEFERRLVVELKNLEDRMLSMQDKIVREAVEECNHSWRVKLEDEVNETVKRMEEQYVVDSEKEKSELEKKFKMELEKQCTEFDYALKREQEFCEVTMRQLRHCLECKNLANLMYVLCMERRKCTIEQSTLEYVYKNKICDLEENIRQKEEAIKTLIEEKDRKQKQLDIREECLLEILKQFQKFINFALRAVPTQAEFLLSVEKMILYEVAKQTWQQGKKAIQHLCRKIIPWKSESDLTETTPQHDLEPRDYHKCLDEIAPKTAGEESDVLPYFYYQDKMYVRGDLQYYFDHDIRISESDTLWSKDVEDLMQILKAVSEKGKGGTGVDAGSECGDESPREWAEEEEMSEKDDDIPSLNSKQQLKESKTSKHSEGSRKSSVSFSHQQKMDRQDMQAVLKSVLRAAEDGLTEGHEQSISTISPQPANELPVADNVGILAAQDSLATIRMSRKSSLKDMPSVSEIQTKETLAAVKETLKAEPELKRNTLTEGGNVSFEHFQAIRILDEIELTKPRSTKSSKTSLGGKAKPKAGPKQERESILSKGSGKPPKTPSQSKLLSATDSLIIHRTSLTHGSNKEAALLAMRMKYAQQAPARISHGSLISKLSFTKDSLELIRRQSMHSKKEASADEVIVLAKGSSKQVAAEEKFTKVQKVVSPLTVSHIEVAKIPTDVKEADVRFSPIHEVYETNILKTSDSPWNIYRDKPKPDDTRDKPDTIITRPSIQDSHHRQPTVQVMGEAEGQVHLQSSSKFAGDRISSILNILKEDPSLIRLFTAVKN